MNLIPNEEVPIHSPTPPPDTEDQSSIYNPNNDDDNSKQQPIQSVFETDIPSLHRPPPLLLHRIRHELWENNGWFSLEEFDGRQIDIQATFAPAPLHRTLILRIFLLTWTVSTMIYDFIEWKIHYDLSILRYCSKLTHVTMTITVLYQSTVLLSTLLIWQASRHLENGDYRTAPVRYQSIPFYRAAWVLYVVAATMEFVVLLSYWTLDYKGQHVTYVNCFKHGIIGFLVLFDGNVLGRIPIRIRQMVWCWCYAALYLSWTLIYSLMDLDGDDTAPLYPFLDWKKNPIGATKIFLIVSFVLCPMVFFCWWMLSLRSTCCRFDGGGRRLCRDTIVEDQQDYNHEGHLM